MAKKVGPKYQPSPTNHSKKDSDSFRNSGQKAGKKAVDGKGSERNREEGVKAKLRKISKAMFGKRQVLTNHSQVN